MTQSNPDFELPEMPLPPGLPADDDRHFTAAEVKVLTDAALRLGRKEAGEDIADAIERLEADSPLLACAYLARYIGSQPSGAVSDERSGTTEPQEAP